MRKLNVRFALIPAALAILSGCASIVSDSQYPVSVITTPAGATFEVRNRAGDVIHSGTTPGSVTLKSGAGYFKGETYTIAFRKEGFADQQTTLNSSLDGWYWGNIIFGGLIGMLAVDPATGAMYKLPENTATSLAPVTADAKTADSLTLITVDQVPEALRDQLVQIN
ncbi:MULTISPECIES: hypothetical protein [unclassified Pseudomonas]|uniref:hypothetical protein n=1 Tax=unclassified Pseudomonas TaxID=196821 RepID=UPI001EDF50AA|nr:MULTISPECIES: hypothetical protein [unclassified Pseudomonas]MCG4451864.1 hypothetical protein [Pseudomonas sp. MMS21 TM103]